MIHILPNASADSRRNRRPLSRHSHHIQHPSRNTLLSAVRKVSQSPTLIPGTSRTLAHHSNLRRPHASIQQLPAIRFPKIHPHPARIPSIEELLRISKLAPKLRAHLFAHRITASPNTRPNSRHQILRPRSILLRHLGYSPLDDPRRRPSPPRMKRRHHPLLHIDHQHRHAIRRPHSQQHPRHFGDQPIPLQHRLPLRSLQPPLQHPILLPNYPHGTRMNLPHSHQHRTSISTTNTIQKPPSILRHQGWIILLRPSEIQRSTPINPRNPTIPHAEPMPQPSIPLQPLHGHNLQTAAPANFLILNVQPIPPSWLRCNKTILESLLATIHPSQPVTFLDL
jgi:hypothetical protein